MEGKTDNLELFWEKYCPKTYDEIIGHEEIVNNFKNKKLGEFICYTFAGPAGSTKSVLARIIGDTQFKGQYRIWNMSLKGHVETVETSVIGFCDSTPLDDSPYLLAIFEEADGMSKEAQKALRVPMLDYAKKVKFILLVNYKNKIINPVQSRTCVIPFHPASEKDLNTFANRIIKGEGIKIQASQVEAIVKKARGDFRKVANDIQGWTTGNICRYKDYTDVDVCIENVFDLLVGVNLDKMIDTIITVIENFDAETVLIRLAERIRFSDMPFILKAKCMKACQGSLRDIVNGVDIYCTVYAMCSDMVESYCDFKKVKK